MRLFFYWIYLWQLHEYRLDLALVYLRQFTREDLLSLVFIGQKRRPSPTIKAVLIAALSAFYAIVILIFFLSLFVHLLIAATLTYFLTFVSVSLAVGTIAIPSRVIGLVVARLASVKVNKMSNLIVIGVTGSYGKTSTKDAIAAVLSQKYSVLKTPGGVNTKIGVSLFILKNLNAEYEVFVVEMGAYKRGEIKEIVNIVRPDISVVTGINEQHIALFGSIENTIKAKFEIVDGLNDSGVAVLNVADANVSGRLDEIQGRDVITYSSTSPHENVNAAIAVAKHMGLSQDEINAGREKIAVPESRFNVITGANGVTLIDDSYNSNPSGFRFACGYVNDMPKETKILVTTGVYELGKYSKQVNTALGDLASSIFTEIFVVEVLHKDFIGGEFIESAEVLLSKLDGRLDAQTVILFEGRNLTIRYALEKLK
ncbi:UDP-N-acetylmuramoyl-tripeptide--D-alanyl-D-alanine ligase [candidate division WWE3 bacterium]|uniref:UDP-N-acetylmuramoyl-tripeptide--D-alanyl-D-alanine ligase n=1 Tax=candidate division WWE3 bacterium TaxID=2053526 RepID=A0A955LKW4_UNCKA|nr:UDP-N-acetylmuramoyl-tripeptide--D-alanyl-D-alanine ligase [candidate division WWE3 bacterium]